jgi:GT2 family glycosyltransferase
MVDAWADEGIAMQGTRSTRVIPSQFARARSELAWLRFALPRRAVAALAARLPLARLRDALPPRLVAALRLGLYPARVERDGKPGCERRHPAWGDPAELDESSPVRLDGAPRASVLVVSYGNLPLTRLCLASLQRARGATPFEVIVVDNASPDGAAAWLAGVEASGRLPLRLIPNPTNVGFAAANNQAARLARGPILVFLNNDTVVTDGWLDRLVGALEADRGLGLVGPMTNSAGNPEVEDPAPYPDLPTMAARAEERSRREAGRLDDVSMLPLFCTAMPRALFDEVGGLDEGYGVGLFEDDDLSAAVRRRGRRVVVRRDTFVHHYGGAAFSRLPSERYLRLFWENRRRYENKWGVRWQER